MKPPKPPVNGHILSGGEERRFVGQFAHFHAQTVFGFHLILDANKTDERIAKVEANDEFNEETCGEDDSRVRAPDKV